MEDFHRRGGRRHAGAFHSDRRALHRCRNLPVGLVGADRHPFGGDAGGGDDGFGPRSPLQLGLYGRRRGQAALLRLSVVLHLRHAGLGDSRRLHAVVLRLGGCGPRQLSPDRLLASQGHRQRRGDQGLCGQPDWRRRFRAWHYDRLLGVRDHPLCRDIPAGGEPRPSVVGFRRPRLASGRSGLRAPVHWRHGQVGAVFPAHLAARRHGRPNAGFRPDPRRDHGDGGCVHGLPALADVRIRPGSPACGHDHRCGDGPVRRHGRPSAERH